MKAGTVFVIDDEATVRKGLSRLLRMAGLDVITHESARSFLDTGLPEGNGCILLDMHMPGMTGPELHDALRESASGLPVIYLTGQCSVSDGVRAMKKGAFDFLEKPVDAKVLLPTIEKALATHRILQERQQRNGEFEQRFSTLSPRERSVLDHVVIGLQNKHISAEMGIAEKTVKKYRGRAMAKMRCRSVAELVRLYATLENHEPA